MLYAGLGLSRKRLDVHVLRDDGATAMATAVSPDALRGSPPADGTRGLLNSSAP